MTVTTSIQLSIIINLMITTSKKLQKTWSKELCLKKKLDLTLTPSILANTDDRILYECEESYYKIQIVMLLHIDKLTV